MIFTVSLMSNIVGNRANCLGNVMNSFRYSLTRFFNFVHLCVSPPVRGINHSLYYKRVDNLHADTDKPW